MSVSQQGKLVVKMTEAEDELGYQYVQYLAWYNKGGIGGDDLLVTDADGNTIWQEAWPTDGEATLIWPINSKTSTKIETIDNGALYIVTK